MFNKLEHVADLEYAEQSIYRAIEELVITGAIIIPYSNAHTNDLVRGYSADYKFATNRVRDNKSGLTRRINCSIIANLKYDVHLLF